MAIVNVGSVNLMVEFAGEADALGAELGAAILEREGVGDVGQRR